MATFSQGIELVSVTSLKQYGAGVSSYTVPSGHYAEISIATAFTNGFSNYVRLDGINILASNALNILTVVSSGTVVTAQTDSTSSAVHIGIKVYKNP